MQVGGTNSLRKLRRDWWKTRLCTSCVSPLGRLISRGGICPQCGLRVCKNCRSELDAGSGAWVCVLCSSGGMSSDNLAKGSKSLGRDSRSIRRSWTISNPQRAQTNSPVLKSYTVLYPEESTLNPSSGNGSNASNNLCETPKSHRQFHSLPRMSSESERSKKVKRSFNSEFEKENIKRHRSFQTTLHPYQVASPPSPSASINFIEDPFWDYYDYDLEETPSGSPRTIRSNPRLRSNIGIMSRRNSIRNKLESEMDRLLAMRTNSNRSSCERSLGETYDYDYSKSNYNSLSDTELHENSKFETIPEDHLLPRRFSTESSNFYRFATITPINMSPLNDPRKENPNNSNNMRPQNVHIHSHQPVKPERRSTTRNRRSISLNAYDGKKLFSPLRTYVVVMKENVVPKDNSISDSITNANINSTTTVTSSVENTGTSGGKNNGNTSSVLINSSSNLHSHLPTRTSSEVNINNSSTKFHSLPRERVIRIEREDWRFAKPSSTNNNSSSPSSTSNAKKISKVEITRSVSSAWDKERNTTRVPIGGNNKIARSQSYREISSTKPHTLSFAHHEVPVARNNNNVTAFVEKSNSQRTATLPLMRTKEESSSGISTSSHQKPFFNSLLDGDKESIAVMENFLKTHNQNRQSQQHKALVGGSGSSSNEKSQSQHFPVESSKKTTDFIQSQKSDFENFQRQQIETFDNYLRQCSTFPRALDHQKKKIIETEPTTRHKTTTLLLSQENNNDVNKNFDNLYEPKSSHNNNERIVPIFRVNGDDMSKSNNLDASPSWNATLPHPYVRKHKQQKSSFLDQKNENDHVNLSEKFQSSRIHDIEREIERDIYFQKTKSLDRARPHKSKPSILEQRLRNTAAEDTQSRIADEEIPPVASPRLKRKAQILQANSNSSSNPKINTEQSHNQECVIGGSGTSYLPKNKIPSNSILLNKTNSISSSRLPNEPGPTREYAFTNLKSTSANSTGSLNNTSVPVQSNSKVNLSNKKDGGFFSAHKDPFSLESRTQQHTTTKDKNLQSKFIDNNKMKGNIKSDSVFIGGDDDESNSDSEMLNVFSRPSLSPLSRSPNAHSQSTLNETLLMDNIRESSSSSPIPIATPRTRRKNQQQKFNNDDDAHEVSNGNANVNNANSNNTSQDTIDKAGDTHLPSSSSNVNGSKSQSTNLLKAVRFEAHVIEENERRHNKAKSNANNGNSGMRMNNNFNNKLRQHLSDTPVSSSIEHAQLQYTPRNHHHHHHYTSGKSHYSYHQHGGVKSLKPSSSDKTKKRSHNQAYGFVARAIAKVKSKAKGNKSAGAGSKSVGPITNINHTNNNNTAVRSVETRDSITYISPPPTQQQSVLVAQEINPITSLSHTNNINYFNQQQPISSGLIRAESFNKLKNESVTKVSQDPSNNANNNPNSKVRLQTTPVVGSGSGLKSNTSISPPKPKRSSLKMDHSKSLISSGNNNNSGTIPPAHPVDGQSQNLDQDGHNKYLGLTIDQLTPSSSSSSSSSFMSNLQESYDFFHESEECESIEDDDEEDDNIIVEDESDQEGVLFKSFEDDEDAGEDFIFYSNQLEDEQRASHAYKPNSNVNTNANANATGISSIGSSSGSKIESSSSISIIKPHQHGNDFHREKKGDKNNKIFGGNKKGLQQKGQVEIPQDNRKDGNQVNLHHPQITHEDGKNIIKKGEYDQEEGVDRNFSNKKQVLTTSRLSDLMISENINPLTTHEEHVKHYKNEKEIPQHLQNEQIEIHGLTTLYSTNSTKPSEQIVPQAKRVTSPHHKNTQWANQIQDPQESNLQSQSQTQETKSQYGTKIQGGRNYKNPNNSSEYLDLELSQEQQQNNNINPKFKLQKSNKNNLLLPSSFIKSATLPLKNYNNFNQSEFFPGEFLLDQEEEGMSMCNDNGSDTTINTNSTNNGKFKSRVLVNPSSEESSSHTTKSPPFSVLKLKPTFSTKKPKNVTTVDISGDVGIVSTNVNASTFLNNQRAQLKKVNESLWKNDVYASGLRQLSNQTPNKNSSSDTEDNSYSSNASSNTNGGGGSQLVENVIVNDDDEEDINNPNGIIGSFDNELLLPSSVSNNGSGGGSSDEKIGSSSGSEVGSDWHSESTKNTVIFRGDNSKPIQWPSSTGGVFNNYNCVDPEIHINSITLVDNVTGNGVTSSSSESNSTTPDNTIEQIPIITSEPTRNAKLVEVEANEAVQSGILNKSLDDKDSRIDIRENVKSLDNTTNCSSSVSADCDILAKGSQNQKGVSSVSELKSKSKDILDDHLQSGGEEPLVQMPEEFEMVQSPSENPTTKKSSSHRHVPSNKTSAAFHQRRESPEGQEQEVPSTHSEKDSVIVSSTTTAKPCNNKTLLGVNEVIIMEDKENHKDSSSSKGVISKSKISQNVLSQITATSRSSPDGADAERSEGDSTTEPDVDSPTPMIETFDVTSDEDSWVEEIIFEDDDTEPHMCRKAQPPPLDLTLHTIVEESCEESEAENSGNFNNVQSTSSQRKRGGGGSSSQQQKDNELEKYFNFGIYNDNSSQGGRNSLTNEESEFSDTFSESSFSLQDEHELASSQEGSLRSKGQLSGTSIDPAELASSRLEKYFYNLGLPQSMINPISAINQAADSDSVGSESESDNSVLENRKKVLKHHRRSADFEDEFGDKVSDEEEDFGFGQDGFDTIKKTARKVKKSGSESNLLDSSGGSSKSSENLLGVGGSGSSPGPNVDNSTLISSNQKDKAPLGMSLSNGTSSSKEESSSASPTSPSTSRKSGKTGDRPVIKVNRSNSFTWSSDEEVNIMMSKLRQLIRNLVKSKTESNAAETSSGASGSSASALGVTTTTKKDKDKQLAYLENELIRLMKSENLKNIVEYFSSEESDVDDVYKFIKVVKESGSINSSNPDSDFGDIDLEDPHLLKTLRQTTMQVDDDDDASQISPKGSPALLAKVMHHISGRLAVWMKDENLQEDDNNDDNVTLKCAQSVSSDLNEDRFSWKGSFESALAAKRQSVGSTDSISSSDFAQDRSILRSSSLHHLANSSHHLGQLEENKEEEEASSLPRMTNLCNSLPRLNQPSNLAISRAHSLVISGKNDGEPTGPIKSARYRPPGFQPGVKSKRMDDEGKNSPILSQSTPVLTQDPANLKVRSDSMGSIFHDTKPHICVKGQVEFGLQYNYKLACLEVRIKQCRDLAAVDNKRNRSDPYVKAYLLPDRSKAGKRKTKTKKNSLNPLFDEVLKFPLTLSDLQNRTLWLSVWNSDIFGKNEFLGEVLVELKDRVFDDPNPQLWDLQEMSGQTEDMPRGDVVIALKWQPKTENTGNLAVLVKEAKNLTPVKNGTPSTFIKCMTLSDKSRKHKTSICRRSYNPVWNQTLNFEDVDDEGLEITLWNHDLLSNHDLLGTIRLDYDNPLWESMLSRHSFWVEGVLRLN